MSDTYKDIPVEVVKDPKRPFIRINESAMDEDELYRVEYESNVYFIRKTRGVTEIFKEV